jgi:2-polyprenyl-6-methoxyphenol hydroxylase-like FAD-dependent oxidoreductase
MTGNEYDVIVVGARCAGSPTAMLLARKGYRVLVVDKATFPSDTVSTHLIHPPGVATLRRWGLLDRLAATGCPPIDTYRFDFGPVVISGSPAIDGEPVAFAPRRTVLDELLVTAAREAGAEVRERFGVDDVLIEGGRVVGIRGHRGDGTPVTERARVLVGADGRHSLVARAVQPEQYHEKRPLLAAYYAYWSGLPMEGRFDTYVRPYRGIALWPTNDDLTMVIAGWPFAEFEANRVDVEANYLKTLDLVPELADRLGAARRETRFSGTPVHNYFRRPYGPGWALVGDAGYNKDYITAQGIQDAFRQAELCAAALDDALSGARPFDVAMDEYQATRDEQALAMYEFTCELATLDPPPPELAQLLGAVAGSQAAMDDFARLNGGAISPAEFFAEPNVARIVAAAGASPERRS